MPQKPKKNKIRIKINDKKITGYMFDFTRTIIFVFAIISVALIHHGVHSKADPPEVFLQPLPF